MNDMTPEHLAARIFAAAEQVAQREVLHFGKIAAQDLKFHAADAARQILAKTGGDLSSTEGRRMVSEAEAAFAAVAEAMVEARPQIYDATQIAENVIGEKTFMWAKKKLCPLWPFCD